MNNVAQAARRKFAARPAVTHNACATPERALQTARAIEAELFADAAFSDTDDGFPIASLKLIAAKGLLAAPLPADSGGCGLGTAAGTTRALLEVLKSLGRGNLAVGRIYEGHVNALLLIALYGTPAQQIRYASDARDEQKLFGVWNTEIPATGVRFEPLTTGDRQTYRMTGGKIFATGCGALARPVVNGALPGDGGWQMSVVPLDTVQTEIDTKWWQPLGMRATRSYQIDFDGVEIGAEDLLGLPGDYYREPWFSGGCIRFAAVQLGGAEKLLDETRRWLQKLGRTDDAHQRARVAEMAWRVESGNLWLDGAARTFENFLAQPDDAHSAAFLAYARLMRAAIEDICETTMKLCERCIGARGLMRPLPFERIIRDLIIYLRQPAPDASLNAAGEFLLTRTEDFGELWQSGESAKDD